MDKETKGKGTTQSGSDKNQNKKPNIFSRLGAYFKSVFGEVKKLSWPTRKDLISYTLTVLAFVALFAIIIGVLDMAFEYGIIGIQNIPSVVTPTPAPTAKPTPTPDPDATEAPDVTDDPDVTDAPEGTDAPEETDPETTDEP
ncbi:MAG: preprotein translocase subunit SecE [Clostridia bacterium]|nr:preprotein translocase subunit SecE [Oscillospiraceae bacterium]MBQ3551639.1 preprotein translocase subunit SecE [Clostridia bacterium]